MYISIMSNCWFIPFASVLHHLRAVCVVNTAPLHPPVPPPRPELGDSSVTVFFWHDKPKPWSFKMKCLAIQNQVCMCVIFIHSFIQVIATYCNIYRLNFSVSRSESKSAALEVAMPRDHGYESQRQVPQTGTVAAWGRMVPLHMNWLGWTQICYNRWKSHEILSKAQLFMNPTGIPSVKCQFRSCIEWSYSISTSWILHHLASASMLSNSRSALAMARWSRADMRME